MFSFICSLFALSFFVVLPLCFSADDPKFTECSLPFECGTNVSNLYYPFWGNGRAEYCGHPDFKLDCKEGNIVELEVGSQSYRVLSFDKENNTIHITTTESINDCPSPTQNISLPSPIFNYNLPGTVNLTLAYGCPRIPQLMPTNTYPCSVDDISDHSYYWVDPDASPHPDFWNCKLTVTIPVLRTVSQSLNMVMEILKDGFEVRYDANNSFCRTCEISRGQCGYDMTGREPTCFCYDGQYQGSCPKKELGTVLSIDESYETCLLPVNCGRGPNISYPFWVDGEQNPSCGSPGFGISCKDRQPIITLSSDEYIIHDIVYKEQSLHISKNRLSNGICSPLAYRVEFNQFLFSFVPNSVNLSLFFNCTALLSIEYSNYSFGCSADTPGNRHLALLGNDSKLEYVNQSGQCTSHDVIHVDVLDALAPKDFIDDFWEAGFHLKWNAAKCDECSESGGRCGFNFSSNKFMCFCRDQPHQRSCYGPNGRKKVAIRVFSAIGGVILVVTFLLVYYIIKKSGKLLFFGETAATRNFEQFIKRHGSFAPKRYSFKEIKKMTQSFKNKLGHGGYGSVFKGVLNDGRLVAVKVLTDIKGNGEEFINEVASISRTSHVNIVSLLGYCFDGSKRALIYEYMPNGSLEKYIYDKDSSIAYANLGWATLHDISVGIARGLEYLHRGCNTRILHFDIKPHNILLDQDFCPKISDFGLAKLCPRKDSIISMLGTRGTAGYIAPEVFSRNFGSVSHKSDVYSYGMMILEMVGGRKNIDIRVDHTSEIYFPNWIYKRIALNEDLALHGIDSKAQEDTPRKMILVGLWCIQTNPFDRPAMTRVLEMLEGNVNVLEIPPNPYLSSPPRTQGSSSIN